MGIWNHKRINCCTHEEKPELTLLTNNSPTRSTPIPPVISNPRAVSISSANPSANTASCSMFPNITRTSSCVMGGSLFAGDGDCRSSVAPIAGPWVDVDAARGLGGPLEPEMDKPDPRELAVWVDAPELVMPRAFVDVPFVTVEEGVLGGCPRPMISPPSWTFKPSARGMWTDWTRTRSLAYARSVLSNSNSACWRFCFVCGGAG